MCELQQRLHVFLNFRPKYIRFGLQDPATVAKPDQSTQGKTMQDIATIMGLSVGTIEKHLRMARDALDAKTTAHAVQKAMSLNLLGVED